MATITAQARSQNAANDGKTSPNIDMKLEVIVIPVSDVDRAKRFYASLGWRLDADFAAPDGNFRVIQFTPPGSEASVIFGKNVTAAAPGSAQGLYLVVSDIAAARASLLRRGVDVSDVFHGGDTNSGADEPYLFGRLRVGGPDAEHRSYRSFASFKDPDGNGWLFQEVTSRLPGRVDPAATSFSSAADLAAHSGARKPRMGHTKSASATAMRTGPAGTQSTS